METGYIVVFVIASCDSEAEKIGKSLVEERLAASVSLLPPVRSFFTWKGEFYDRQEVLLVIKTRESLFPKLRERVKGLHSYEVPEIIALPILAGSSDFLGWVDQVTGE